ncbi:tRNA (guanine-N1)-methyltransferase [Aerococcus urinaehominis]|uniref:tRNA (guanine-N(1)-)-methyltransferase n=1 Tax=Aerococcus urinaehominis TaxID=128944 RepID=A0A120IAR7_9LACT|nr:tRNA (guanosine(37)-N1)-methyltransferase TrmD [Aerococcus urinaehominis]AMB98948.1 tRNA (guanine-N1)-methyltransferase [Aerococcus urinaehominis]SDM40866.1 tRNA (guanine37-N1)-methyltransferase [Aerococcus urinaehominis]
MRIDFLTLFPDMFTGPMTSSILGKAQAKGLVSINTYDFRQHATNKHGHVDDYPYGGGAGMLLQVEPIHKSLAHLRAQMPDSQARVILMDPAGPTFNQAKAEELAREDHLIFICGHYEGYDDRIRNLITDEISIGDYVLTGGELGAMVVADAVVRLKENALGNAESAVGDSFSTGLLEHPQYTRPRDYNGWTVPDILLSGDHAKVAQWQAKESLRRTYQRRPDLLENYALSDQEQAWLAEFQAADQTE